MLQVRGAGRHSEAVGAGPSVGRVCTALVTGETSAARDKQRRKKASRVQVSGLRPDAARTWSRKQSPCRYPPGASRTCCPAFPRSESASRLGESDSAKPETFRNQQFVGSHGVPSHHHQWPRPGHQVHRQGVSLAAAAAERAGWPVAAAPALEARPGTTATRGGKLEQRLACPSTAGVIAKQPLARPA